MAICLSNEVDLLDENYDRYGLRPLAVGRQAQIKNQKINFFMPKEKQSDIAFCVNATEVHK